MRVRDYTSADRAACLAVFESNMPKFFAPAERDEFAAFLDAHSEPYSVVEDENGLILGCGGYVVQPEAAMATLCWGMVTRERHGCGLGRLLLRERIDRLLADPAVIMVALNTSQHTRGFYERAGFATEYVIPDGYAPGLDRCELRLVLPPFEQRVGITSSEG